MIDPSCTVTLYDAIQQFREYIIQNFGAGSKTAQAYIQIADDIQRYAGDKELFSSPESIIQEYYGMAVGVPPFEAPSSRSKERCARAIRMIQDIINGEEPKRRYLNHQLGCPTPYQAVLGRYETFMRNDQKSDGTIRTRSGRIRCFSFFWRTESAQCWRTLPRSCLQALYPHSMTDIRRRGKPPFYIR